MPLAKRTKTYRSSPTASSVHELERSVISARRQQLAYRVQFCRALSGSDVATRKRKGE